MSSRDDVSRLRLWPWLVALVAVALAVWLVLAILDRTGPPPAQPPVEAPAGTVADERVREDVGPDADEPVTGAVAEGVMARTAEMRRAVREYEERCAARLEPTAGRGTGAIVADCIRLLGAAVDAVVASDTVGAVAIDARLARFRERVRQLRSAPPGTGRTPPTRALLLSAAAALETIGEERYPRSLEVDGTIRAMREAARALEDGRDLGAQQELLRQYFTRTGALLGAMARPGDPGPGAVRDP